jgi:hypothetical protein
VQKTFLASVSTKLAKHCCQKSSELDTSQEALRIFLAWLIYRDLNEVTNTQKSLAQAWNFGAQYDIPNFQVAVMHLLVLCLHEDHVDPGAVIEAYAVVERDTKLQRAFVAQIAIDMRRGDVYAWERPTFTDNSMEMVLGFYLDLTDALREADQEAVLEISDFLFEQQAEDDIE